jgi:hypothetical protein
MIRKGADNGCKTTVNPRKTTMNPRISGSCYKSFRLNGAIFRRNSACRNNLGKARYRAELMSNAGSDLRLIMVDDVPRDLRNILPGLGMGDQPNFPSGRKVKQCLTDLPQ